MVPLLVAVFLMAGSVTALAAGSIDLSHDVSLAISFQNGNTSLTGAQFDIYMVATVDEYGELTTTEDFSQFNVDIRGENDEAWKALASTLEGYVLRDAVVPTDSGKTDSQGLVSFPTAGKTLTPGLYLVLGERHTQNGYRYDPAPFMVMLPGLDKESNVWNYAVTAEAKYDSSVIPDDPDDDTVDRKVLKVWEDNGHEQDRPNEVIVQLLRDGAVYDTVTLNAANNWRYTWANLDGSHTWVIAEKELDDYTVKITREGITFVITNTYEEDKPDDPPPDNPNPPVTPDDPTLPQTGQLWWPVPLLLCGGLILIVIGLIRRKETGHEK